MNFKQLEFKINLYRCKRIDDYISSKKLLYKTYDLAHSLNYENIFLDQCNILLNKLDRKNRIDFSNKIYFRLKDNLTNELIDFIEKSNNYDLLYSILIDSSINKSEELTRRIVVSLYKKNVFNLEKELYLIKNFTKYVDINWIEDFICHFNDVSYIYSYAKNVSEFNVKKFEDAIISSGDIEYVYKFMFVKNVDISRLEDFILNSNDNKYILKLLDIPQIDTEKIENYILNSNNSKLIYGYLINYNCNLEFIKKLIDTHNYELLYKLKNTIFLSKEISELIDIELMNSSNELYICSVIISDYNAIYNLFGNVNNMLIYLANKYREEKNVKWIKLYDQLKSKTDSSVFDNYYKYLKKVKKI